MNSISDSNKKKDNVYFRKSNKYMNPISIKKFYYDKCNVNIYLIWF